MAKSLMLSLINPKFDPPQYEVNRCTLIQTCADPQILECETTDGIILYVRWNGIELVCLEKRLGTFICSGEPILHRGTIGLPLDQIEFYLEMYSKHKLRFC
jgi:hypothetical protein